MTDATNKEKPPIPTREEHARTIRRLWWLCIGLATFICVSAITIIVVLIYSGVSTQTIWAVFGIGFPIVIASYAMAFFVPVMITSVLRMGLGIEMSRQGLEVGIDTSKQLGDYRGELHQAQEKVDRWIETANKKLDEFLKAFREEMGKLRREIRHERGRVVGEMDEALAEGEKEAEAILRGEEPPPKEPPNAA
jgi:hypothetical protein